MPAALSKGTYLGIFRFDPFSVKTVVPEHTLPGVDAAVVPATRNALKSVRALLVPRCRWNRVGLGLLVALAQPAALTMLTS